MECKWSWWMILALCATGIPAAFVEPQSISISSPVKNRSRPSRQNGQHVRRFACPIGFFRLNRYCYYLSAGMSTWRDAYFNCKDRNATLAVLDKSPKERTLRKYLMGEQFTKLERWIGGIFNWQRMAWEWGVAGEKMDFQNFADPTEQDKKRYEWDCVVMDPTKKYKWTPTKCYIKKHYICEVPAGRIVKRRKKTIDPLAPQNQRLKPRKKGKKYTEEEQRLTNKRHRTKMGMRRRWEDQTADQQWAHGVRPGSRPPGYRLSRMKNRIRHRHPNTNSTETVKKPSVAQILPKGQEYGAFLGDGPSNNRPQTLADLNNVLTEFNAKINDFAREEVLLKP